MKHFNSLMIICFLALCINTASAQKPFTEGTLVYKVKLASTGENKTSFNGIYIFSFKGDEIKKELKLDNGYEETILYNCATSKIYTLQNRNGTKYAIQLSMDDIVKKQQKFSGFSVGHEEKGTSDMAGNPVFTGTVTYKDGVQTEIAYTKAWKPAQSIAYNRFPGAQFLPLRFSYNEENGTSMTFDAEKIDATPIASSVFRIPADYKMISYEEYKQYSKE